jgi:hypothetical protein
MNAGSGLRRFVTQPDIRQSDFGFSDVGQSETGQSETGQSDIGQSDVVVTEKCEMCATEIPAEHGHVADLEASSLTCACRACYLLFTDAGAGRGRYRAIPDRYLTDPAHPMSASEWDSLEIPVGLAFFLRDSRDGGVTGFYPSPAGATECRLDLGAWDQLGSDHPLLAAADPDVEAVLISRSTTGSSTTGSSTTGSSTTGIECFVVPVDACYELAGRMRLQWRGFDGGTEARASIAAFLEGVRARARDLHSGVGGAGRRA